MRIDVSPIINLFFLEPMSPGQMIETVSRAKNYGCIGNIRKRQEINFVPLELSGAGYMFQSPEDLTM